MRAHGLRSARDRETKPKPRICKRGVEGKHGRSAYAEEGRGPAGAAQEDRPHCRRLRRGSAVGGLPGAVRLGGRLAQYFEGSLRGRRAGGGTDPGTGSGDPGGQSGAGVQRDAAPGVRPLGGGDHRRRRPGGRSGHGGSGLADRPEQLSAPGRILSVPSAGGGG